MPNRNFNASAIAAILQAQTAANNFNKTQFLTNNAINQLSKNSEINNYNAAANTNIIAGSQTYFQKGGLRSIILGPPEQFIVPPIFIPPIAPTYNTIVSFTEVGPFSWTAPGTEGSLVVTYIIVGGGGGAGGSAYASCGGGGGGGRVLIGEYVTARGNTVTGTVGAGGTGGTGQWDGINPVGNTQNGIAGENSSFDILVAEGGGGGIRANFTGAGTQLGGVLYVGGGGGNGPPSENGGGGGGGGNGSSGSNGIGPIGGSGGLGIGNPINATIFGAGGAGGTIVPPATDVGGESGPANTGNGGNALNVPINFPIDLLYSGYGGSGIVILAYNE